VSWVNAVIQGMLLGGQYALIACGLSLAFGVMRIVNLAHGDLAVCGAYLGLVLSSVLGVPVWVTLPLLLPAAFVVGMGLQATLFGRALRHGVLAPVLVTFGLSIMIENLLQVAATSDPRGLNGGALTLASFHITGGITVSWLFLTAFLTACAVLSCLQLLLSRTSWGRKVRATADDLDTARLVGIKVRPVFATVAGIAVATAALAGVFIGTIGTFDPQAGANTLIFAFEAVVIGGIGSLWGTLAGGVALGITQVVVGEVNQAYAVLAVHLLFLAVLTVRPGGLFTSHQPAAQVRGVGGVGGVGGVRGQGVPG
jgi:branched-chain amino acid transport system permease protein